MAAQTAFASHNHNIEIRLIKRLLHACIYEQLLPHLYQQNRIHVSFSQSSEAIVAHNVYCSKLGKFSLNGGIMLLRPDGTSHPISSVQTLLRLMYLELNAINTINLVQWENFVAEINNCITNKKVVTRFIQTLNYRLAQTIARSSSATLFEYIGSRYSPAQQLLFYEAWATQGHPYHPCHKTKLGFNSRAHRKYSPEFTRNINLPIAAIAKSIVHLEQESSISDYCAWFSDIFPHTWHLWCKKMAAAQLIAQDYYPIFIHPWQYENIITTLFHDKIVAHKLILFPDIWINTKASLSFRTLIAQDEPHQPHIKLPVAVHSTSAMRTISPASIHNGPKLSAILRQIIEQENYFNHSIQLAFEICGMHVRHPNSEIAKHLGIIYRENPTKYVKPKQCPIVVAALFEISPINQLPLLIEIIRTATNNTRSAAIQFFDNYCRIVIRAYLDLYLVYGIALEGHQQNTLAVFENNQPVYLIARDFGGLRIHSPSLQQQGYHLQAHPNSVTITNNHQEVTNKFLHSVIQYHLGEIVSLLTKYYDVAEEIFWGIIKTQLEERFQAVKHKTNPVRWNQEYKAVFEDDWQIKGLMRMRLNNIYNQYIYLTVSNPLRGL